MRIKELLSEKVDPGIVDQQGGFEEERTYDATPGITYRAISNGSGDLTIYAFADGKRVGTLPLTASSADAETATVSVENGHVIVKPEYQRKGIARQMYIFAQELGNTIVRSAGQTDQGKALWDKGLQGVIQQPAAPKKTFLQKLFRK